MRLLPYFLVLQPVLTTQKKYLEDEIQVAKKQEDDNKSNSDMHESMAQNAATDAEGIGSVSADRSRASGVTPQIQAEIYKGNSNPPKAVPGSDDNPFENKEPIGAPPGRAPASAADAGE